MELLHQTKSDVLRTFLSLSGVSIGIFVVTVSFALVDAFSRSVVAGFDHFGSDMIMVERFPVISDGGSDWSRYAIRPQPSADDYMVLSGGFNCKWTAFAGASGADIVYGGKALRDCKMVGVQGAWQHLVYSGVCAGRAFSLAELSGSEAKAILGAGIVRELFGVDVRTAAAEACQAVCGRTVRLDGRNMTVIGVLSYEGKNIINLYATDFAVIVPFATAERIAGRDNLETMVAVGPKADLRDVATEENAPHNARVAASEARSGGQFCPEHYGGPLPADRSTHIKNHFRGIVGGVVFAAYRGLWHREHNVGFGQREDF